MMDLLLLNGGGNHECHECRFEYNGGRLVLQQLMYANADDVSH